MYHVRVLPTELPATGVKYRSITQPRVSLITFSPPWNGGIFETYRLTGLRIVYGRTCLPKLRSKSWGPRETCFKLYNKTHAHAFLVKEMFEVGFELVPCRRRQVSNGRDIRKGNAGIGAGLEGSFSCCIKPQLRERNGGKAAE